MTREAWRPGDHAVLREVWRGQVWNAKPVTVVQDSPELLALYLADGTWFKQPRTPAGDRIKLPAGQWQLQDVQWVGGEALYLLPAGAPFAVVLDWHGPERRFGEWYIDLQRVLGRSRRFIDGTDDLLDIVVSPDLAHWRWKDEDELAEALALGLLSEDEVTGIRVAGQLALECLRRRASPFGDGWERWAPPPAWGVPRLPPDWDRDPAG